MKSVTLSASYDITSAVGHCGWLWLSSIGRFNCAVGLLSLRAGRRLRCHCMLAVYADQLS